MTTDLELAGLFILWERSRTGMEGVGVVALRPEFIQREVRRRFPNVTLVEAYRAATRLQRGAKAA